MLYSSSLRIASIAVLACGLLPSDAHAGPLIDWLFGRNRTPPAYAVGAPTPVGVANPYATGPYATGYGAYSAYGANPYAAAPYSTGYGAYPQATAPYQYPMQSQPATTGYAANYGTYYGQGMPVIGPAGAGYQAQMPSGIAATTMPGIPQNTVPQTLSYVPNFNSYSNRAAVTYYRPLLTTDPNTGAQVVAMAPCTSYEYQTQRVPAFGRSALYGSTVPPFTQPAPAGLPTYTLPSGGIPLAGVGPSVLQPTVRGYGVYPQAGISAAPGTYPTAPLGQSAYYGSNAGGSCGAYQGAMPVPGLVAPQAPVQGYPPPGYVSPAPGYTTPAPGYQPDYQSPNQPGIYPPNGAPSADPAADVAPTLPPSFPTNSSSQTYLRPKQLGIVRQPSTNNSQQVGGSSAHSATRDTEAPSLLKPIPVPDGFEERPRWNPGLLQENDLTAERSSRDSQVVVVVESKKIHWASFEGESRALQTRQTYPSSDLMLSPSYDDSAAAVRNVENRRTETQPARQPAIQSQTQLRPKQPSPSLQPRTQSQPRQYDNHGWEVAK